MTPFRSDRDADLARIEVLERELDATRRRVAEREAREPPPRPLRLVHPPRTCSEHGRYTRTYEIDGRIAREPFADAMRTLEELAEAPGKLVAKSHHRSWSSGSCSIDLIDRDGRSTLMCTERLPGAFTPHLAIAGAAVMFLVTVASNGWQALGEAAAAAVMLGALCLYPICALQKGREHARIRFDRAVALLGVEVPRELPPGAAIAAGDQGAR